MASWWEPYESDNKSAQGSWWEPYEKAKSKWGSLVDTVSSDVANLGEGALRALPQTVGFLGDIGNLAIKGVGTNPMAPVSLTKDDIPGMGPASKAVMSSYDTAEQSLGDQVPVPKNRQEKFANAIGSGIGSMMLLGGPKNVGSAVLSGIGAGVGGEGAHEAFPNSEWAPLIGSVVGGGLGVVPHVAGAIKTGMLIRAGMAHPDFETLVDHAILPNEGGGTLDHPKVNASSGATGPMQVTPETARDPGYGIRPWDGKSQADLARVGRQKFAVLLAKYDDPEKALAAYNWGEGNLNKAVSKYGHEWYDHAPEETQNYVAKGMTKVYGGPLKGPAGPDGLPTNGSVVPIDSARLANIMQDQGMMDALNNTPKEVPVEDVLTPAERQDMDASVQNPPSLNNATDRMETSSTNEPPPLPANDGKVLDQSAITNALYQHLTGKEPPANLSMEDMIGAARQNLVNSEGLPRDASDIPPVKPPEDIVENLRDQNPPARSGTFGTNQAPPPEGTKSFKDHVPRFFFKKPKPEGGGEPPESEMPTSVQKLQGILDEMNKLRSEQDAKVAEIRRARMTEAGKRSQRFTGESGAAAKMGALRGKMPETEIRSYRPNFSQEDLDGLFDQVQNHPAIDWQTNLHATTGLQKLLFPVGNRLPTASELKALNLVFPKEVVDGLKKHSTLGEILVNTLSIPRALMASADFSAPLRQGVFLIGRKEFYPAAKGMFKKAFSQKDFDALQNEIASRPTYSLMNDAGLSLTDVTQDLTKREEVFQSNYAEKYIPVLGRVVKGSDRAYIAFLNKVRADVFDSLVKRYEELHGESISKNPKALRSLGDYINTATGRGSLGRFTQSAPFISAGLFAPRLIMSRLKLLNPIYYAKLDPFVRKEALKDLFKFASTALTVLTLAKMGGADVEADPRSTDFGKIRIKDTRFDILGGFQQYIRTFAQIITSQAKNSDTGKITNLIGGFGLHVSPGEEQSKFKPTTAMDEASKLVLNKAAPVPGLGIDLLRGGDAVGQKLDWTTTDKDTVLNFKNPIFQRVTPLVIQDTLDAYKEYKTESALPAAVAATGVFGVGTQTYEPVKHEKKSKASKKDWWADFEQPKVDKYGDFK